MIRKPCLMADRWDESKQMRKLVSRCPRGPRSGADVDRELLAGEGGADGDEVGGCALEDDPAAVVAGAVAVGAGALGAGAEQRRLHAVGLREGLADRVEQSGVRRR